MCGIAGFIGEDRDRIEQMTASLIHRGPDGNAVFVGRGISFGHARLAILDPTPNGDQPMWNEAKTIVIVFNGEIYNFRRLREQEELSCTTESDTEVLLKLYEKYGIDFVRKLLGMFAFALYDTVTKTLHLARDCGGIKPLFVTKLGDSFAFASEMRTLMKSLQKKPMLNTAALSAYLTLQYVPGPETMCTGIESLPPGTILSLKDGVEKRTTFQPDVLSPVIRSKTEERKSLPNLLREVVKDHMIADRPIGIFLSGGMDSSVILHHMAELSSAPVKTFTVRFDATEAEDAARFNRDADLALLTAKHYGTHHEELLITAEDFRSAYEETARALDQPNADSVSVAQYLLAKKAKQSVDVVLSGAGGDELFGGYPRYRIARILSLLQWMPPVLRTRIGASLGYPADVLGMTPGADLALRLLGRPAEENRAIAKGDWFEDGAAGRVMREHFARVTRLDAVRQMMEADRSLWLVDESLRLADAVTMASGLECRVPFTDPRLVAWSLATPASWHVGLRRTKMFLKDAYRGILPEHLCTLGKSSFYPPLAKWIRREAKPLVEGMLQSERITELFDIPVLRKLQEDHNERGGYNLHALSSVTQLSAWFRTVYDA